MGYRLLAHLGHQDLNLEVVSSVQTKDFRDWVEHRLVLEPSLGNQVACLVLDQSKAFPEQQHPKVLEAQMEQLVQPAS